MIRDHVPSQRSYLAISSKKSMCVLKIHESLGAKSVYVDAAVDRCLHVRATGWRWRKAISAGRYFPPRGCVPDREIGIELRCVLVHHTIRSAASRQ